MTDGHCPLLTADPCCHYHGDATEYMHRKRLDGYVFRPALECWAPCFPGHLVAVGVFPMLRTPDRFHVSVWGADDEGCAVWGLTHDEARALYLALPLVIEKRDLIRLGFDWD